LLLRYYKNYIRHTSKVNSFRVTVTSNNTVVSWKLCCMS